jgi:hypothetical protein
VAARVIPGPAVVPVGVTQARAGARETVAVPQALETEPRAREMEVAPAETAEMEPRVRAMGEAPWRRSHGNRGWRWRH